MIGSEPPRVSIVTPVFRNAETLVELAARLRETMRSFGETYELVFVNDGSPDASSAVIAGLAEQDPAVAALELPQNIGQHRAVCEGLRYSRGAWVVILDADLQDPPEAIPRLLEMRRRGYDAVFAGRSNRYQSWHRMLTSRMYKWAQHEICGVPPNAGIYMALSRHAVDRLLALDEPDGLSVVARVGLTGLASISVPVPRAHRPVGMSSYSGWDRLACGTRLLARAARWRWRHRASTAERRAGHRAKHRKSTGSPLAASDSKLSSRWRQTSG